MIENIISVKYEKSLTNLFPNIVPKINQAMRIVTTKGLIGEININETMKTQYYE